ncbi:hypothetical protein VTO42DRAFT_1127 [Malbranchea cinnamomea]
MWTSISAQALSHFKPLDENIAYNLWEILEITHAERPQTTPHRLLQELNFMTSKSIGYIVPDFIYFNTCITGISARYCEFLQNRMDQTIKGDSKLLEDDLIPTLRDILTHLQATLPSFNNASPRNAINYMKDNKDGSNQAGFTRHSWGHGGRGGHSSQDPNKNGDQKEDKKEDNTEESPVESLLEWILNIGSSSHATFDPIVFTSWSRKSPQTTLTMANKSTSRVEAEDNVEVPIGRRTLPLRNVHLVKDLGANLISLGQLIREGFTFRQTTCNRNHYMLVESPDQSCSFKAELTKDSV